MLAELTAFNVTTDYNATERWLVCMWLVWGLLQTQKSFILQTPYAYILWAASLINCSYPCTHVCVCCIFMFNPTFIVKFHVDSRMFRFSWCLDVSHISLLQCLWDCVVWLCTVDEFNGQCDWWQAGKTVGKMWHRRRIRGDAGMRQREIKYKRKRQEKMYCSSTNIITRTLFHLFSNCFSLSS